MSHCSQTFPGIFIEKTRFEEFEEEKNYGRDVIRLSTFYLRLRMQQLKQQQQHR